MMLVDLGGTWANPEEVAAVLPVNERSSRLLFQGHGQLVQVSLAAEEVVRKFADSYLLPTTPRDS